MKSPSAIARGACALMIIFSSASSAQVIQTVAGGFVNDGAAATDASFAFAARLAKDGAGNVYVSDAGHNRVRRIGSNGLVSTIAGTGIIGYSGDGGPATAARISNPLGIQVCAGEVVFADRFNNVIRRIDGQGLIRTIAGTGTFGYSGDGGPATQAALGDPTGLACDGAGNFYWGESGSCVIRHLDPGGLVHTIAGNGACGSGGEGVPATSTTLNVPFDPALDGKGNLFFSEPGRGVIRKIDASGILTTFASVGNIRGLTFDASGNLITSRNGTQLIAIDAGGAVTVLAGSTRIGFNGDTPAAASAARFQWIFGIVAEPSGSFLIADAYNGRVRRLQGGVVSTVAGGYVGDGGPATRADLNFPNVSVDPSGNLLVSEFHGNRVRKIDAGGTIATVAGSGLALTPADVPGLGDGGPATSAIVFGPIGVAGDASGNLFIGSNGLREVSGGIIHTIRPISAWAIAADGAGNVYVAERIKAVVWRIDAVTPGQPATIVAGKLNQPGYNGDAQPAVDALLNAPSGVALDSAGNLYIGDAFNNRVRKIDATTGLISTVAGDGTSDTTAGVGDGGAATAAVVVAPEGVGVDRAGNLFISDASLRVRKVTSAGVISTVAGDGTYGNTGDGGPAAQARLILFSGAAASGLAVDARGNVYFDDGQVIRKISFDSREALSVLVDDVKALPISPGGQLERLLVSLDAVEADLASGDRSAAARDLQVFAQKVAAQAGKHLSAADAQSLIATAQAVQATL